MREAQTHCKRGHSLAEFYKSWNRDKSGYTRRCKVCQQMRNERWEKKNPEKKKAMDSRSSKRYRQKLKIRGKDA